MFRRTPKSAGRYPVLKITIFCGSVCHYLSSSHPDIVQNARICHPLSCSEDCHIPQNRALPPSIVSPRCSAECQNLPPTTLFWRSPTFTIMTCSLIDDEITCRVADSSTVSGETLCTLIHITVLYICRNPHHWIYRKRHAESQNRGSAEPWIVNAL